MVTKTDENDDLPTHDTNGVDLAMVRRMLAQGYDERLIAECLGITTNWARQAIVVATDDRQGAPTPDEIVAACLEIQSGWDEEQAKAAKHGEPRLSSRVVRDMDRYAAGQASRDRHHEEAIQRRVQEGVIPIVLLASGRWGARVQLRGRQAGASFDSREEAEAWGRSWLRRQYEIQQAGACCGR